MFNKRARLSQAHVKETLFAVMIYSLLFLCIAGIAFYPFVSSEKNMLQGYNDGLMQDYTSMGYIGKYYRSILQNVLQGNGLKIPLYDLRFGLGDNPFICLQAFSEMLNPIFIVFAMATPLKNTELLFHIYCIFQLYCVGLAMLIFCRYRKFNDNGSICAALTYAFSGFALFECTRHFSFLIPMIALPLLCMGIEKGFKSEKPWLLIVTVFLSTISSYFFAPMLLAMTVIYALLRFFECDSVEKSMGSFLKAAGRCARDYMIGLLLCGFAVLPVYMVYRMGGRAVPIEVGELLHYDMNYYKTFFALLFTPGCAPGYASLPIIAYLAAVLIFAKHKKYLAAKIGLCLSLAACCVPFVFYAINNFTYITDRAYFILPFIFSIILAQMFPEIVNMDRREKAILVVSMIAFAVLAFCYAKSKAITELIYGMTAAAIMGLILLVVSGDILPSKSIFNRSNVLLLLTVCCITLNGYMYHSSQFRNYVSSYDMAPDTAFDRIHMTSADMVQRIEDESFFRVDYSMDTVQNAGIRFADVYGTSEYWSLMNSIIPASQMDLENAPGCRHVFSYKNFDQRAALTSLASVKYYTAIEATKLYVPYGFSPFMTGTVNGRECTVYKNAYPLPLGYCYDRYIPSAQYDRLSALDKQEAMLQAVVVDDGEKTNCEMVGELKYNAKPVKFDLVADGLTWESGRLVTEKKNATMKLTFTPGENAESYLRIGGLVTPVYFNSSIEMSSGMKKGFSVFSNKDFQYSGQHDYLVNLGAQNSSEPVTCTITWPTVSQYELGSIEIWSQSMENYGSQIEKLNENTLQNIQIGTNAISGTLELDQSKILCVAIPYDKGWKAFVDGQETPVFCANKMYLGIQMEPGSHTVRLEYFTPGLKIGMIVSGIGLILVAVVAEYDRRGRRGSENSKTK